MLLVAVRSRHAASIALVLALAACVWRIYLLRDGASMLRLFNGSDTRADGLMIGAALTLAGEGTLKRLGPLWPGAVAFLLWAVVYERWNSPWLYTWGLPAIAAASAILIAKIVAEQDCRLTRFLELKPLAGLGVISYAFYVWHYPILFFLDYGVAACFAATLACAIASRVLIERPVQQRRGRIIGKIVGWLFPARTS